jgi:hypothetical protein
VDDATRLSEQSVSRFCRLQAMAMNEKNRNERIDENERSEE